jgi:hypothetical protein
MKQHKLHFTAWLKDLNIPIGETPKEKMIYLLATSPHSVIKWWQVYDINGFTFYTKAKYCRSQCQNSGVRVDAKDSTRQKILIMGTLKKFGMSIMEYLYKFMYSNVNGWSTHMTLRWMNMGSQLLTREMWVIKMNLGFLFQLLHKCFIYLIWKMWRNTLLFLANNELSELTMWRMRKNTTKVSFFVDTIRINIVETKISYSNVIPYTQTDGEGKLVHV